MSLFHLCLYKLLPLTYILPLSGFILQFFLYSITFVILHRFAFTSSIKKQLHKSSSHSQITASLCVCSSPVVGQLPFSSSFSQLMIQVHSIRHAGCSQNRDSLTKLHLVNFRCSYYKQQTNISMHRVSLYKQSRHSTN